MNDIVRNSVGLISGAAIAILLTMTTVGVVWLAFRFFPAFAEQATWFPWLTLIVLPTVVCVWIGSTLWRKRKPIVVGIIVSALALGTHFAVHVVSLGNG